MKRLPADVGLGLRTGIRSRPRSIGTRTSEIGLQALEDRDRVALAHLNDRLLPLAGAAGGVAAALRLRLDARRADLQHADVEQRLDRLTDLCLVGVRMHTE